VPDRIQAQYNALLRGERLTTRQRKDFVRTAKEQALAQFKTFQKFTAPQRAAIEDRQLPSEQIFPQFQNLREDGTGKRSGMTPEQRKARLEQLRAKKGK
jgi:hypothetical protein